ncbi:MAG: thioredoxin domain-containing protein, partial [bacterium]|nr:thioredoxin domain-containing protein [bacterium]
KVLDPKSSLIFQDYYDISTAGNWENRSILNIKVDAATVASKHKLSLAEFKLLISSSREKLYQARNNRSLPIRDEKILTAWNSLMISAFSKAGFVLNKQIYIDKAVEAAQFILANLIFENKLYRSFKDKKKGSLAFLDDYAFFIAALLDLYEATFDLKWLENAIKLDKILAAEYEDKINGGFFMTSQHHEKLITREKPSYDGAEPSGNSAAILNLLRLNAFTSDEKYYERAVRGLQYFAGILQSNPISLTEMLLAVDFYMNKTKEIAVIKGKTDDLDMFLQELRRQFTPNKVLTVVTEEKQQNKLTEIIPWLQDKTAQNSKTTAYVCEKGTCHLPTTDPAIFSQQLTKN